VVSGIELIEDVRKAPDNVLSMTEAIADSLEIDYTLDLLNKDDIYHAEVIRSKLTRNLAVTFKEVREELINALEDSIPTDEDKWVKVDIMETLQRVICSATNRAFVGVPLCRNLDYHKLNLTFAINVVKYGTLISFFPGPLKPIVARMLSNLPSQIQQEIEFIRPMVEERFAKMEEFGDDWDKPNDMLMWLMSEAKGVERSVEGLARRLLTVNFAAIHTTSQTFTQVLYSLLSHPEYIEPLREEVEAVVAEEGWTKAAMDKMHKIDSFVRETMRIDVSPALGATRRVLRPFTFSNGVTIPAGTHVAIATKAIHTNEGAYENATEFDGFRFAKLRESEGNAATGRHQIISISTENLVFGLGRHACPGRFFSANEVKMLLAHLVVTYDMQFEEGKGAPLPLFIAGLSFPRTTDVMFRTRQK